MAETVEQDLEWARKHHEVCQQLAQSQAEAGRVHARGYRAGMLQAMEIILACSDGTPPVSIYRAVQAALAPDARITAGGALTLDTIEQLANQAFRDVPEGAAEQAAQDDTRVSSAPPVKVFSAPLR